MCLDIQIAKWIKDKNLQDEPAHLYSIRWDGLEIGKVSLPTMTQSMRDEIRLLIAKEYSVLRHQMKLQRIYDDATMWSKEFSEGNAEYQVARQIKSRNGKFKRAA